MKQNWARMLGIAGAAAALAVATALPANAAPSPGGSAPTAVVAARDAGAAAVQPVTPTNADRHDLVTAYTAARRLPAAAVGRIRPGSLHLAAVSKTTWAIASFEPSAHAGHAIGTAFQDGAGTGVFSRAAHQRWRLVQTGPYGCGRGLPAVLLAAWHLGDPAACHATVTVQRATAATALAAAAQPSATTRLGQRIADIALGEIGTSDTPASTNFGLDCDPYSSLVAGFSGNADGCGVDGAHHVRNENEEWCADFTKWVWQQAGVTADMNTLNAGSVSFYQWALDQGQDPQADTGTPAAGDAIVFFSPGKITPSRYAVHVGIVTAVHPDGTVDMANPDFRGRTNISVQYNTNLNLTDFAAAIYGTGEQWVIVTPTAATHPAPTTTMAAPGTAVSGTATDFTAAATEPGGSITRYYWTFGDGRSSNTLGPKVSHVFAGNGIYPVSVTATSSFGTARTVVKDVDVVGASSAVASVPSDAVWFASTPIDQYSFVRSASGDLAVNMWDGASWLQETAAGQVAEHGGLTALAFPDPAAGDATTPHVYFRSADGNLAETSLGATGWVTQALPGTPAPGSAIVAATTPDGVAVFYATAQGRLAETTGHGTSWATATVPGPPVSDPGTLALAGTADGPVIFYPAGQGLVIAASVPWSATAQVTTRPVAVHAAPGSGLAAITTAGQARVFFVQRTGSLATTTAGAQPGNAQPLPGHPAAGPLAATAYLLPAGTGPVIYDLPTALPTVGTGAEVFSLTTGGQPAVTYRADGAWQTAALPGSATGITGADAYQVAGQPTKLLLTGRTGPSVDFAAAPADSWSSAGLPDAPATFPDRVMLYAAQASDRQVALQAASSAGLPASQVTGSYATAWDATLSGQYLVITVGYPATTALYYNVCGWTNPSTDIAGSTPFYIAASPLDRLPGADAFENGSAATAARSQDRVTDLAYYAVHGQYPAGVTSAPAAGRVQYSCQGSQS